MVFTSIGSYLAGILVDLLLTDSSERRKSNVAFYDYSGKDGAVLYDSVDDYLTDQLGTVCERGRRVKTI